MYWDPSVLKYTGDEYDEWFDAIYEKYFFKYNVTFDIHGDYVEQSKVQETKVYYFDADTYDKYYYSTIDCCVCYADNFQTNGNSTIPPYLVKISELDAKHKESD